METILVTGASGFVGSHLVRALTGKNVITLGRQRKGPTQNHICADLRYPINADLEDIDTIYHLAGLVGVHPGIIEPMNMYFTNVTGTSHVLDLASRSGVKNFVYVSSTQVYESEMSNTLCEDAPIDFSLLSSDYAKSKALAEQLVSEVSDWAGFNACIVRLGVVYGPGLTTPNSIHRMVQTAIRSHHINAQNTSRSYLHISDCIDALLKSEYASGIFNVDNGVQLPLPVLAKKISEIVPCSITVHPGTPWKSVSIEKARSKLGWTPSVSVDSALPEFVEYMNDRYRLR